MYGSIEVTRASARQFVADWFGFDYRRVNIHALQRDERGQCISIQFQVHSYFSRWRYLARRRCASADWELILLP